MHIIMSYYVYDCVVVFISIILFFTSSLAKLRERLLILVGKAYTTIRVPDLCTLLGQSEAKIKQSEFSNYRIAGYFRGVYVSRTANSILVREK